MFLPQQEAGFGAIIWNSDGGVIIIFTSRFPSCRSPFLTELLSCHMFVRFILNKFSSLSVVVIDALLIYKALTTSTEDHYEFSFIVENYRMMLKERPNICVRLANKQKNKVVHLLDRSLCDHPICYVWESIPIDILTLLNV